MHLPRKKKLTGLAIDPMAWRAHNMSMSIALLISLVASVLFDCECFVLELHEQCY